MPKIAADTMNLLKLIALDEEDLAVVSSHLQDAVVRVGDLAYLPSQKRFAAVLNRFDWEKARAKGAKDYRRRRTALRFDRVFGAQLRNLKQGKNDRILSLLAVRLRANCALSVFSGLLTGQTSWTKSFSVLTRLSWTSR